MNPSRTHQHATRCSVLALHRIPPWRSGQDRLVRSCHLFQVSSRASDSKPGSAVHRTLIESAVISVVIASPFGGAAITGSRHRWQGAFNFRLSSENDFPIFVLRRRRRKALGKHSICRTRNKNAFTGSYAKRFRPSDPPETLTCPCGASLRTPSHLIRECPRHYQARVNAGIQSHMRTLTLEQLHY
jgi:hypothetical protein